MLCLPIMYVQGVAVVCLMKTEKLVGWNVSSGVVIIIHNSHSLLWILGIRCSSLLYLGRGEEEKMRLISHL